MTIAVLIAQAGDGPLLELLKVGGGLTFGGLAVCCIWMLATGRVVPRFLIDRAEEREKELRALFDRALKLLEDRRSPPKDGT